MKVPQTTFTKELDKTISKLKEDKEDRQMSLLYASRMMECRRDGYEEGLFTGREEGISIGLEQGAYQSKLETARRLVVRGFSSADIADLTGLDVLQIDELRG